MTLPLPTSLSPSKVSSFKDCALAFRFSAIDRLPEPASPWATKGTLVHRALELLFWEEPQGNRSLDVALTKLDRARAEMRSDPEFVEQALSLGANDYWVKGSFNMDTLEQWLKYYLVEGKR